MNYLETTNRFLGDERERRRLKFHSETGIKIPRTKKELHRLQAILRKIDKRGDKK